MISKNDGRRFISPRLSIVDGTHLCLLPSLSCYDAESGSGHDGRGVSETKHTDGNNDKLQKMDEDEDDVDRIIITVPALPLSSICNIYDGEYMSCLVEDGCEHMTCVNNQKTTRTSAEKESTSDAPSAALQVESISLRASDIINTDYRFIHSTSLVNGSNTTLPLRVTCDEVDEGIMILIKGDNYVTHVEVCLPSFTSFDNNGISSYVGRHKGDDECKTYGGEHYNINLIEDSDGSTTYAFEVRGAGSCLIADFLGIAAYEQALVLPQLDANLVHNMLCDNILGDAKNEESIHEQQKRFLQMILQHSVLTDGTGIIQSKVARQNLTATTKTDDDSNMVSFTMSPLEVSREVEIGLGDCGKVGSQLLTQEEGEAQLPSQSNIDKSAAINNNGFSSNAIKSEDEDTNEKPQEADPPWLEAIAQTVEHRLAKEAEQSDQIKRSTQARSELVQQGRRTLHAASRPNHKMEDWNDLEVFRLRYGVRPRTSSCSETDDGGGITVMLDMELDVVLRGGSVGGSETARTEDKHGCLSSSSNVVLHDFHISCSLATNTNDQHKTTKPENIRTSSGVVPTLQPGDCITMLVSVRLIDIKMAMQQESNSTVDISIQGLWVDPDMMSTGPQHDISEPTADNNDKPTQRRHGAVLCILRLPIETLFLGPPTSSSTPQSGHWIQHEIDFMSNSGDGNNIYNKIHQQTSSYPVPSAIFEYRQPRTITIDASSEMNSTHGVNMWKTLVATLNASIGGTASFIDLYCKKDDPRLKLVIFASSPEERAATVKLVLRSLPESAKLIVEDDDDDPNNNEKRNIKALLLSIKKEADALKKHRALPAQDIRPELLAEMATLQSNTDGVASTIKRGWVG